MIVIKSEHTDDRNYNLKWKLISLSLTNTDTQFKRERIEKKLTNIILKYNNNHAPNIYKRCTGQSLAPLLEGKTQYHKMKKNYNMEAMKDELVAYNLQASFTNETNWTSCLKLLKQDENNKKYVKPLTAYERFKWNSSHFEWWPAALIFLDRWVDQFPPASTA